MMMSEVYWFDCSQRMPETDRMVLVYGSAIGGTRYAGYERSLNEWVLDDMETVSARDVTMWAELPVPPAAHGAPNGFDWTRRYAARLMDQAAGMSEREASTGGTMELVLIRGLPGSGKTTMARVLALVGYEHHEADHYFERDGAYKFDPADLPKAHAWCLERAKNSIARGARCVVANTFTRRWEMQPYMDAAKAAGVPVRVIEARGEWANCHGVPADAIERMRARWEFVNA